MKAWELLLSVCAQTNAVIRVCVSGSGDGKEYMSQENALIERERKTIGKGRKGKSIAEGNNLRNQVPCMGLTVPTTLY